MSIKIHNVNNTKVNNKNNNRKNVKGAILGAVASVGIGQIGNSLVGSLMAPIIVKESRKLNDDEIKIVNNAADTVRKDLTNLKEKGVKVVDFSREEVINVLESKKKISVGFDDMMSSIEKGTNAYYISGLKIADAECNEVLINRKKMALSEFHELGHAFNYNNTKVWKTIQKMGGMLNILALGLSLVPVFTKCEKPKDGEELTKKQKLKNGFRKMSPILAALVTIPTILEENRANMRAKEWAKKVLSPDLCKKMVKENGLGFLTYLIGPVLIGLGSFAALKIKDKTDKEN